MTLEQIYMGVCLVTAHCKYLYVFGCGKIRRVLVLYDIRILLPLAPCVYLLIQFVYNVYSFLKEKVCADIYLQFGFLHRIIG